MAFRTPSASNTFSISWDSTHMLVSSTRDPEQFKLAQYIQYVPTKTRVFRYLKLDLDEPARVPTTQEFAWAPGTDRPTAGNVGAFQYVDSSTVKYAYPWTLPQEALDQAEFQLESSQTGIIKQKAMTVRTMLVSSLAQTASNWPTTNTDNVSNLNGGAGKWDTASSDPASAFYLAIKKALIKACTTIVLQTNGVMKWQDVNCVVSPNLANKMGNSSEIYDYVKGSPDAFARQKGEDSQIGEFGLPGGGYAGVKFVVEDAVKVTSRPNISTGLATSGTRAFVWDDASPTLMSRKGGVAGTYGGSALSTIQLYAYREMESWSKVDTDNERTLGSVVDDIKVVLPFGQSGFLITGAL